MKLTLSACVIAATLCLTPLAANAQASILPGLRTNGCGAAKGWSSKLVPNASLIGYCQFEQACNVHDICYGRCLEGGALYGKPECEDAAGSPGKKQRQMVCDATLGADIVAMNKGKRVCSFYAALYQWAVERYGASSFSGIGEGDPVFKVIREFLNYAQKHPDKYSDQDQVLLLTALNGIEDRPNDKYTAMFDKFSGKFTLTQVVDGNALVVVQLPQATTP